LARDLGGLTRRPPGRAQCRRSRRDHGRRRHCSPSHYEGRPTSSWRQATGLAVVASDIPGRCDLVGWSHVGAHAVSDEGVG
jgi:hypothetical protein